MANIPSFSNNTTQSNLSPFVGDKSSLKNIELISTEGGTIIKVVDQAGKIKYASTKGLVNKLEDAFVMSANPGIDPSQTYNNPTWISSLSKDKVGLGNVSNTLPIDLPLSNAAISALSEKANINNLATINGQSLLNGGANIIISGGGSATTNASDLIAGILPDERLSSNVLTTTASQNLQNKNISGSSNNITNIAQSSVVGLSTALDSKQATLQSGVNVKTVNNQSIVGSGNITISAPGTTDASLLSAGTLPDARLSSNIPTLNNIATITNKIMSGANNTFSAIPQSAIVNLASDLNSKQPTLQSGTNIKTINSIPILGAGDIVITVPTNATFIDKASVQSDITGNKSFTGTTSLAAVNLNGSITLPNATLNFGSTSNRLANLYATNVLSGGGINLGTTSTSQAISIRQGASGNNIAMFAPTTGNLHLFAPGANPTDSTYRLHVNGTAKFTSGIFLDDTNIPTYESNDAAITGGVQVTQLFKTVAENGDWIIKMAHPVNTEPIFGEKVSTGNTRVFWPGTPIEQSWKFQSANEDHNARRATNKTNPVYRFEINSGETWQSDEDKNNGNNIGGVFRVKERTECYQENTSIAPNVDVWISYSMYIEPGANINYTNSDYYCILGQWHAGDSIPTSGPSWQFELSNQADIMLSTRGQEDLVPPFIAGRPYSVDRKSETLTRGAWYNFVVRTRHHKNTGQMDWWVNSATGPINSTPVYSGTNIPIGYDHTVIGYWKFGIYRTANANNLAVRYANMEIKVDATNSNAVNSNTLKGRIASPLPIV